MLFENVPAVPVKKRVVRQTEYKSRSALLRSGEVTIDRKQAL